MGASAFSPFRARSRLCCCLSSPAARRSETGPCSGRRRLRSRRRRRKIRFRRVSRCRFGLVRASGLFREPRSAVPNSTAQARERRDLISGTARALGNRVPVGGSACPLYRARSQASLGQMFASINSLSTRAGCGRLFGFSSASPSRIDEC